jgi:hypothetical protein
MLRSQGIGWSEIAGEFGVGVGTLYRVIPGCSKTREKVIWNPVSSCRDGRDNQNNGHDDQQPNQRKTLLFLIHCFANRISYVFS